MPNVLSTNIMDCSLITDNFLLIVYLTQRCSYPQGILSMYLVIELQSCSIVLDLAKCVMLAVNFMSGLCLEFGNIVAFIVYHCTCVLADTSGKSTYLNQHQ